MLNLEQIPNFPLFLLVILIEAVLKAFALWKAARNGQRNWFIVLFVLNTAGILPLLYMRFFQKKD